MRRLAPHLAACALLLAGAAQAHPFTLDDLLARQRLVGASFSPGGRWLVTQSTAPYRDITRFDLLAEADLTVSRLDVVDLRAAPRPRRLFSAAPGFGYLPGPFSPSGDRMAVIRVAGHAMELGVVDLASGQATWTGTSPIVSPIGQTLAWRGEDELLAVTRGAEAVSFIPFYEWQAKARLQAAWRATEAGGLGVTEVGSGRYLGRHAKAPLRRLVSIKIKTGQARTLFEGDVFDLALSPDARRAALLVAGEDVPADPDRAAGLAEPFRRQRLAIVDLVSGQTWRPWTDHEVAPGLLAWSPGGALLLRAKPDAARWNRAAFWRLVPETQTLAPLDLGDHVPAPDPDPSGLGAAYSQWLGETPLVLAKRPGEGRRIWLKLGDQGPVRLGETLSPQADRLLAADQTGLVLSDGARLWRLDTAGKVTAGPLEARLANRAPADPRAALNQRPPPGRLILAAPAPDGLRLASLDRDSLAPSTITLPASETLLAGQTNMAAALSLARDSHGVETVILRAGAAGPVSVLSLNDNLAAVTLTIARPITRRGPRGQTLTDWLYLPPGARPGRRVPLVVVPYPGKVYPNAEVGLGPPGREAYPNAQLLAAAGYAVLLPSLPVDESREPMDGMAARILAAVDAAAAAEPALDTTRLALWGHSYGGYAVLAAATQSPRFKAVISAAPSPDLFMAYAAQGLTGSLLPEAGYPVVNAMGWLESGQARMGAPPWRDPGLYVRNSPILQADRISQPILLVGSDFDGDPNGPRAMFNALYRLNKDAVLLDYHGEGHQMFSPGNLRDLYAKALAFLADHIAPGAAATSSTSASDTAPR